MKLRLLKRLAHTKYESKDELSSLLRYTKGVGMSEVYSLFVSKLLFYSCQKMSFEEIKNLSDEEKLDVIMSLADYFISTNPYSTNLDISEQTRKTVAWLLGVIANFYYEMYEKNGK